MNPLKKILIVDDEPRNLRILKIQLGDFFELVEATSGEEALLKLNDFKPAVILLDVMMPGLSGYEVTQQIRARPELAATKIILVSGKSMIEAKLEGYGYGADDYVTKPFHGDELKAKIDIFVRLYDLENELRHLNASLEDQVRVRSEQLLQSERLAFVGRHACDIVHNLKNPMAILMMHLNKLEDSLPENESVKKMNKAADRILLIIKDILSTNVDIKDAVQPTDINDVVREELELLSLDSFVSQTLEKDVRLEATVAILISPAHLHQIIGNLIKNAVEAMFGMSTGKVSLRTEDINSLVRVTIADSGPGISSENLEKIFTPLFTTKKGENGGPTGNGLGLPYSKKMIESYGGSIEISSILGQGTTVVLNFPAAPKTPLSGNAI